MIDENQSSTALPARRSSPFGDRFGARARAELAEQRFDVELDGVQGNPELARDRLVARDRRRSPPARRARAASAGRRPHARPALRTLANAARAVRVRGRAAGRCLQRCLDLLGCRCAVEQHDIGRAFVDHGVPACATICRDLIAARVVGATIATRRRFAGFLLPPHSVALMVIPRTRRDQHVQRQHFAAANQSQRHCPAHARIVELSHHPAHAAHRCAVDRQQNVAGGHARDGAGTVRGDRHHHHSGRLARGRAQRLRDRRPAAGRDRANRAHTWPSFSSCGTTRSSVADRNRPAPRPAARGSTCPATRPSASRTGPPSSVRPRRISRAIRCSIRPPARLYHCGPTGVDQPESRSRCSVDSRPESQRDVATRAFARGNGRRVQRLFGLSTSRLVPMYPTVIANTKLNE